MRWFNAKDNQQDSQLSLSATVLAGTGVGIAYFMFMVNRSDNIRAIAVTVRNVVLADWIFTTPTIFIQFITGPWLMKLLH